MAQQTPLYEQHTLCGARMVDFHGWMMPLHYGSQIDEHHAVRGDAGMFDVSHMTIVDFHGSRIREFLRYLLANDVAKLTTPGKALYTGMLTASAGVIDDLIVYFLSEDYFRLVVNSATREKDLAWISEQAEPYGLEITVRDDLSLIAVQGPQAKAKAATLFTDAQRQAVEGMKPFFGVQSGDLFIATTGYTGEAGYEIAMPNEKAADFWRALVQAGVKPCGLGARDTLRLEAGMPLYGHELGLSPDGTEIPVSEEDLMAQLTEPDVQYEEDGSVWLHWFDQSLDITDRFEDGVCYVKLVNHGEPLYMTVKYENGYATSSHKYVSPWEFN